MSTARLSARSSPERRFARGKHGDIAPAEPHPRRAPAPIWVSAKATCSRLALLAEHLNDGEDADRADDPATAAHVGQRVLDGTDEDGHLFDRLPGRISVKRGWIPVRFPREVRCRDMGRMAAPDGCQALDILRFDWASAMPNEPKERPNRKPSAGRPLAAGSDFFCQPAGPWVWSRL